MGDGLLLEAQRVERAIARVRWGAAALEFFLGPLFPNLSLAGVFLLGALIVAYNVATLWASARATSLRIHRRVAELAFAGDLLALSLGMLLFSSDLLWTTYFLGTIVIVAGAFRFGTAGTVSATVVISSAYLAVAAFRQIAFGFALEPERALFNLSMFVFTGLLMDRSLRDARQVREEREQLITRLERRVAEDAALAQVMRIVGGVPSAEAVVPAILRASRDVLRFDRATVFVADEDLGEYRPLHRMGADAAAEAVPPPRFKLGEGLVGTAMASDSTLVVPNVLVDPGYVARDGDEPRAVILVPLRVGGRAVAVFSLSRALPDIFVPDDVRLAETVAGLIAQVLENDRLFAEASQAEALRGADKIKDEFLATVSHELRTPLTVIGGSLELLRRGAARDREHLLAQASRHVERLERTVQDLLDLAHLQQAKIVLEREYLPCDAILREAAAAHALVAERRRQRIEVDCADGLPAAFVDRRRVQQLLGNLIANAIRYAPEGSTIRLVAAANDGHLSFRVSDEGPPIPRAERERLFDKFYRRPTHRDVPGGSGLGLAIAKTLAELHGGGIRLEDAGPTGNVFVVELPA